MGVLPTLPTLAAARGRCRRAREMEPHPWHSALRMRADAAVLRRAPRNDVDDEDDDDGDVVVGRVSG